MYPTAEHTAGHDLEKLRGIEAALPDQSKQLAEQLQCTSGHDVAGQLDQVGACRIRADHETALAQDVENRLAALHIRGRASGDDVKFTRLCRIRISKHRSGDIALIASCVLSRSFGSGGG